MTVPQGDFSAISQADKTVTFPLWGLCFFLSLLILRKRVHWRKFFFRVRLSSLQKRCYLFDERKCHETCPAMKRSERRRKSGIFTFHCEEQKDSVIIIIFYGLFLYSSFFDCLRFLDKWILMEKLIQIFMFSGRVSLPTNIL